MDMSIQWVAFIIGNIPVFILIGWMFFRSWDAFLEALAYSLTPDIISLFRGRLAKDWRNEFKFGWFLITCLLVALMETIPIKWLVERFAE